MWLTAASWKTRGKYWRFKWSFAMTTGAWCMLINRWGRKYACWWGEKKGKKCEWQKLVRRHSPRYQKVTKFASPHKSPNRMWYMLQRFDLKRTAFDIKEKKLGQFSICCGSKKDEGGGAGFVSVTPTVNSWENSPSRSVEASSIVQRTRAIGCWIYITKEPELSRGSESITDDQKDTSHQIYQTSVSNRADCERWTRRLL